MQTDGHVQPDDSDATRVSIVEARRLMGAASESMTNDEVQSAIYDLTAIARAYMRLEMVPEVKLNELLKKENEV